MTDDPFLPKASERMQPAQPSAQPVPAAPAPPNLDAPGGPAPYAPAPPNLDAPGGPAPYAPAPAPQVPPVPYYPTASKPHTWMNWTAMGCGIAVLLTCFSFIPAIIFGHLGLAAAKRGQADARGAGIVGLVLGYLGLLAVIAFAAVFAYMMANADFA